MLEVVKILSREHAFTWNKDSDLLYCVNVHFHRKKNTSTCPTMTFLLLGNFDQVVASFQWDAQFHHITYEYSCADWDGLHDYLRDVPWEDIFKLSASAAREFCKWVQVRIDVYIPHFKYQVKSHLSPWFSAACAAAIVHRNHFFLFEPT